MMRIFEVAGDKMNHKGITPSHIDRQVFLLNFPLSLSTDDPNNSLMKKLPPEKRKIDHAKANEQFLELTKFIGDAGGIVYLLPSTEGFQDQVYVSNLGIYLPHIQDDDVIVVANYRTPPRRGEEVIGEEYFKMMGYKVYGAPKYFEGQAELRYIRDNLYIGGWGQRSSEEPYKWMEHEFDMVIPTIETKYPDMYHLDCMCVRLTEDKILCPLEALTDEEVKNLRKYVDIIDMPLEVAITGSFNGVQIDNYFMCRDPRTYIAPGSNTQDKKLIKKILNFHEEVEKISGLEPKHFDLSEFEKSGADLGCMIMHLNYYSFDKFNK